MRSTAPQASTNDGSPPCLRVKTILTTRTSSMQRADPRSDLASHPFQPRIIGGMQLLVCRPKRIPVDGVRVAGQFEDEQIIGSLPVRIRKATSASAAAPYELVGNR